MLDKYPTNIVLKKWWEKIQTFTDLPPGPVIQKMLERADISVKPSTKPNMRTIPLMEGGQSWWNSVKEGVSDFMPEVIGFVSTTALVAYNVITRGDTISELFLNDALVRQIIEQPILIPLVLAGLGLYARARYDEYVAARNFRERAEALHNLQEALLEEAGDLVVNLKALPIEEEELVMEMERNNPQVDPIAFAEFETGNIVAVIKGNKKQPLLVDGLQAWVASTPELRQRPTHPVTRQQFAINDVKLYRVRVVMTGGAKKTRKHRRKQSKKRKRTSKY